MRLSRRIQFTLLVVLVMVNMVLRYPLTPHEIGWDSFFIHGLANSISIHGYAKWLIHPLSVFGLYPYSYPSAVPFILSGISQVSGINMELTIWIFCIFEGIFAFLFAYIMAGEIKNNELFKFSVALAFSISSGMLWFTTWTVSTRGLLLVFIPLLIYFLLKIRTSSKIKYGSLCAILFLVSMATHHLAIMLVLFFIAYYGSILLYRYGKQLSTRVNIPRPITLLILTALFGLLFYLPFSFSEATPSWYSIYVGQNIGYEQILGLALTYAARIGILVFIGIFGFITLLYKKKKSKIDLFLIVLALLFTPILFSLNYASLGILILGAMLIGFSVLNLTKFLSKKSIKISICTIVAIMVVAISWAGLAQVWHPGIISEIHGKEKSPIERYMEEETYNLGLWCRGNMDGAMMTLGGRASRLSAISGISTLNMHGSFELVNEFVDKDNIKTKLSPIYLWPRFGPFTLEKPYETRYTYCSALVSFSHDCDDSLVQRAKDTLNLRYIIEGENAPTCNFIKSVHEKKYAVYQGEEISVWYVG